MTRKYKVRMGDYVRVYVNRLQKERRGGGRSALPPGLIPEPFTALIPDPRMGRKHISFYDLGTQYNQVSPDVKTGWALIQGAGAQPSIGGTRDFVNGYLERDSETLVPFGSQLLSIRKSYLENDPFGKSRALTPDPQLDNYRRLVPNKWPIHHDCGQLFLDATLYSNNNERKYILGASTEYWRKVMPVNERRAAFDAMKESSFRNAPESRFDVQRIENQLRAESEESWLSYQTPLVYQQEGCLIPAALPGAYDLRLDSPFLYEEFDTGSAEYRFTNEPDYNAERVFLPKIVIGSRIAPEVKVFMMPQYWRVLCSFKAWYIFYTYWTFTYFVVPFTFVFHNRFPLFPRPFSIGTPENDPFGYVPVWQWVERSAAHGRVVSQAHAIEFASPFMAIILIFTSDGIFDIRRIDTLAGSLVAVIEISGRPFYIWRNTSTNRDLTIALGQGPLQTWFINSWGADLIGGVPDNPGGFPTV